VPPGKEFTSSLRRRIQSSVLSSSHTALPLPIELFNSAAIEVEGLGTSCGTEDNLVKEVVKLMHRLSLLQSLGGGVDAPSCYELPVGVDDSSMTPAFLLTFVAGLA